MKTNLLSVLMLLSLLLMTSCVKDEPEEPILSLSEVSYQFPKTASEKTITITTNQTEWSAMANCDWIELEQSGNTLMIKASENTTTKERKAKIMVFSGIGKYFEVIQSASTADISSSVDNLIVNQWDGKYTIQINSNTYDWNIISDSNWLTATANQKKGEILIQVAENTDRKARETKIIVTDTQKKTSKEITVKQEGILYFILPYLKADVYLKEIEEFEYSRRSNKEYSILGSKVTFVTQSPVLPKIDYSMVNSKLTMVDLVAYTDAIFKSDEFKAFMKENGFEPLDDKGYMNKNSNIGALIMGAKLTFIFLPNQPSSYPTFEKFPYGLSAQLNKANESDIKKYELDNGGIYNEKSSNPQKQFLFFNAKSPFAARAYFLASPESPILEEILHLFDRPSLAIYEFKDTPYITKEFDELMKKENFEYHGYSKDKKLFSFHNTSQKLQILIGLANFADVLYGQKILRINLFNREEPVKFEQAFAFQPEETPRLKLSNSSLKGL